MKKIINFFINLPRDYYCYAILALTLVIFMYKTLTGLDIVGDTTTYALPHYHFIADSLRQGDIPFWFPYSFWGVPELFKSDMALFNPLTILMILADVILNQASSLSRTGNLIEATWVLGLILGSIGMFSLLTKKLNLSRLPALYASLVFVLCPTILDDGLLLTNGIMVLPWLTLFLINFLEKPDFKKFILLIIANYFILSHGYPYFYVYFFIAQALLVLFYGFKKTVLFGFAYLSTLLISCFFLIPSLHIMSQSNRNIENSMAASVHATFAYNPTRIVSLIFPRLFNAGMTPYDVHWIFSGFALGWGVLAFVFLVIGFMLINKSKIHTWLIILFFISLFYSFGGNLDSIGYFGNIFPTIAKFRNHAEGLPITIFMGAILIGLGSEAALKGIRFKNIEYAFWFIAGIFFVILVTIPIFHIDTIGVNIPILVGFSRSIFLLLTSLILLYLISTRKSKVLFALLIVLTLNEYFFYLRITDGAFADYTYEQFYDKNSLIPEMPTKDNMFRISFNTDQFSYNTAPLGISNYAGTDSLPYKSWYKMQPDGFNKIKNANVKYVVTTQENWQKDNPNVEFKYVTGPKQNPTETFVSEVPSMQAWLARSNNSHYIYEIKNYLPRFYVPEKVMGCENDICWSGQNPPELVMVKGKFDQFENPESQNVDIKLEEYKSSYVKLRVSSPQRTFIVASETWDKDWKVKVNGKEEVLYNVSDGIRGVFVPVGESVVEMKYFPRDVIPGIIASLFGMALLFIVWKYRIIEKFENFDMKKYLDIKNSESL